MINMNWTLKWKVLTGVTLTSALAVVISTAILVVVELRRLDDALSTEALTTARLIGANTTGALAFFDDASATETLRALDANDSIMAAVLFDDSGSPFAEFVAGGDRRRSAAQPRSTGGGATTRARLSRAV